MSSFASTNGLYAVAADASVYVVNCEPGPISQIARAHTVIRQLVRNGEEDLTPVAELLRFARYRLATNLLPAAHSELGLHALADELSAHVVQMHPGTPSHAAAFRGHEAIIEQLSGAQTTLAASAIELLEDAEATTRTIALVHSRNVESTATYLADCGVPATVLPRSGLRNHAGGGVTICVGPHQFFPAGVWSAARSDTVCFVQYPDAGGPPPKGGLFGSDGGLATPRFRVSGATETVADIEPIDLNEGIVVAAEHEAARRATSSAATVEEGVLLLLEGGYAVWTGVSEGQRMWAIDISEPGSPVMASLSVNQIQRDSYVIFRDEGARSELVEQLADKQFGVAKYRSAQRRWKLQLQQAIIQAGGYGPAQRQVRELGALTANLTHWVSRYSIRPNRRGDFDAACKFAGLADESPELWASLSAINRAHLKAGQAIRRSLEQALIADGAQQLTSNGYQMLEIEGLGTLSAFRVVHKRESTQLVDAALIDKPFLMEAHGWQG